MNYFEIIQKVFQLSWRKPITSFALTTDKRYYDTIDAIKNANADFMRSKYHNFRGRKTTFSTVIGQQEYPNIYGNIHEDGMFVLNDSSNIVVKYDYDYREFISTGSQQTGMPLKYSIFNNKIIFDKVPDAVYEITLLYDTNNFVKQINTIDAESASGQKKLYLSSTQGLSQFDSVMIEPDTQREETRIIDTIITNDYVTFTENLTYTHGTGSASIEKKTFEYETDEPNFSEDWHMILVYEAMRRLNFDDAGELQKYSGLVKQIYSDIQREERLSQDSKPFFQIGG